jgi:hypothetical protein
MGAVAAAAMLRGYGRVLKMTDAAPGEKQSFELLGCRAGLGAGQFGEIVGAQPATVHAHGTSQADHHAMGAGDAPETRGGIDPDAAVRAHPQDPGGAR